jgi:hypothetical protein
MFVSTTVSVLTRSINVLVDDGKTERFALVRGNNGEVHWRHDVFGPRDDHGQTPWIDHSGRLTVGEVLERIPKCARDVRRWTRDEIELGADDGDVDIFSREVRRRSLDRLADELGAASAVR